jgi:hypothetical protein
MPKTCTKCNECYPADIKYFYRKYNAKDGFGFTCRACENKRHSERYYKCKALWEISPYKQQKIQTQTEELSKKEGSFVQEFV